MYSGHRELYFKFVLALFIVTISVGSVAAQRKKTATKNQPAVKKTSSIKPNSVEANKIASLKRAESAKRREAEDSRRRAALESQRRREQAAREARARKASFESGLRTQTVDNITIDNPEGEDLEARRAAVNALGSRAGTVVVMEPQTGRILTIVNQDWAIRKSFKPCSTIKLVTAFAGLNESLINQNGIITQRNFGMNLDDALAFSNNAYFQRVGADLGGQKLVSYARLLGLGEPTGLNVAGETGGRVPSNNNNLRIYSHGDDFEVTPLQLAVMVSAISNGGKLVVPQIPRGRFEKAKFQGFMKRRITLPPNSLQRIIPGMVGAASYGTARRGVSPLLEVAGKTGSCIGGGSWLGLFASVAPIENPRLAVVVILRGQAERGKYAAAVAGQIYNALRGRLDLNGSNTVAKLPIELKPQSKIDARRSAEMDDAVDDDTDENGTVRQGRKGDYDDEVAEIPQTRVETKATVSKKTPEKRSNDPMFPTIVITKKGDDITRPRIVKPNR